VRGFAKKNSKKSIFPAWIAIMFLIMRMKAAFMGRGDLALLMLY
jgi:hypothetical protein